MKRVPFQLALLPISLAIAAVVVVVEPIEVAAINWSETSLDFAQVLVRSALPFSLVALALTLVSAAACLVLGAPRTIALLAALLVGLVVQANVFLWHYGLFDGSPIDWSEHAGEGLLELGVWSALLGFAVLRSDAVYRSSHLIVACALAAQLAGAAGTLYEHAPYPAKQDVPHADLGPRILKARFAIFSRSSNVLIIVLDAFQSDMFAELLLDPGIAAQVPPGITYYRNAVAHYAGTLFSLQSILTSRFIGDRVPRGPWQVLQMKQSVPARLAAAGHTASLLSTTPFHLACRQKRFGYACLSHLAFLNLFSEEGARTRRDWDEEADLRSLWNVSLFRLAPHFAKPWIYAGGSWILPKVDTEADALGPKLWPASRRDLRIFRELTESVRARDVRPTFKFLHFFGAHHPNSMTRKCEWNGTKNPRYADRLRTALRQRRYVVDSAACVLTRLFALLARLDQIGVYDNSLIFIVSDHGSPNQPIDIESARPPIPDALRPPPPDPGLVRLRFPNKGVPLFLVKRPGERHRLRTSDAPVALCDIPKSIFRELDLAENYACDSVFDGSGIRRSRRLHHLERKNAKARKGRFVFDRYVVEHHSWFRDSWIRSKPGAEAEPSR